MVGHVKSIVKLLVTLVTETINVAPGASGGLPSNSAKFTTGSHVLADGGASAV
jgi:hypothetical protein